MAVATTKGPSLPKNIRTIKTSLAPFEREGVIPKLSPTVPKALTHSKTNLKKKVLSIANLLPHWNSNAIMQAKIIAPRDTINTEIALKRSLSYTDLWKA